MIFLFLDSDVVQCSLEVRGVGVDSDCLVPFRIPRRTGKARPLYSSLFPPVQNGHHWAYLKMRIKRDATYVVFGK